MYKLTVDREMYIKNAMAHYRSLAGVQNKKDLLASMTNNGVLMNAHLCGWYFEIPLDDVLNILEKLGNEKRLKPVSGSLDTSACFFLRSDIWENAPDFMEVVKAGRNRTYKRNYVNTRLRIQEDIVDINDIIFYYGITRTVMIQRILPKAKMRTIPTSNTRQTFYYLSDVLELEQSPDFQDSIRRSHQKYSAYTLDRSSIYGRSRYNKARGSKLGEGIREDNIVFRDTECSRYNACRDIAAITDYMDCSLCVHNTQKKKMGTSGVHDPVYIFVNPKSKRHLSKLKNITVFPNASL